MTERGSSPRPKTPENRNYQLSEIWKMNDEANLLQDNKRYVDAIVIFEALRVHDLREDPDPSKNKEKFAYSQKIGDLYFKLGNYHEAVMNYTRALSLDPGDYEKDIRRSLNKTMTIIEKSQREDIAGDTSKTIKDTVFSFFGMKQGGNVRLE